MDTFSEFKEKSQNPNHNESVWEKWKNSINMSVKEISNEELSKMMLSGQTFEDAKKKWSDDMWALAKKNPGKLSRLKSMRARMSGNPFERDGEKTNWYKSLLVLGYDPRKEN